jgi:hypothetical protein
MSSFLLDRANIVNLMAPATDAAGRTGAYVTLKGAHSVSLYFKVTQGNAATILITPLQASAVAGTGAKALSANVPIYVNLDTAASNVWVRVATDAKNYTTEAGVKIKQVRFDIDPDALDVAGGFDCVSLSTGASNVANITSADAVIGPMRYTEDVAPTAVVD